jgi:hypothetical protein
MPIRRKFKAKKPVKKPVVEESTTIVNSSSTVSNELTQPVGDLTRKGDESVITIVEKHDEVEATKSNSDTQVENLHRDSSGAEILMTEEVVMDENVNSEIPAAIENDNDKDQDVNMDTLGSELIDGGAVSNGGSEPETGPVAGPKLNEEKLEADVNDGAHNNNLDLLEDNNQKEESEGDEDDDADDGEKDSKDDNKDSNIQENSIEIFVGGLDKKVVEDDLIEVFGKFGEIKAARVVRKANTEKSKGFAFIQYATLEQTKYALSELKDGIEVKGKHVKISTSYDKDALYIGNISETWTKEQVMEKLKEYGIEEIVDIQLADNQSKDKEFAVLKLSSHSHAVEAHKRLSMADAVFGCDKSAKVAFKHRVSPSDETLLQVKKVYIEWPTDDCNEEKLQEICKEYGEITEVKLIKGSGRNRKDFGFVGFTSHEIALACVQGINNASAGEDKLEVKAAMAKPQMKGRTQHRIFSGGFLVNGKKKMKLKNEDKKVRENVKHEISEVVKINSNSKLGKRKGKAAVKVEQDKKIKTKNNNNNIKPRHAIESQTSGREKAKIVNGDRKRKNQTSKKKGNNSKARVENDYNNRPQKRSKGRQSNYNVRNAKGNDFQGPNLASKRQSSDMEPHAGFLQPVGARQVYSRPKYVDPHSGYLEQPVHYQSQSQHYGRYREVQPSHVIYRHHESEYRQPHPVEYHPHLAPADARNVSSRSAYALGSHLPPYVAKYSSYPAYEEHSPGGYYRSNQGGSYAPRRNY